MIWLNQNNKERYEWLNDPFYFCRIPSPQGMRLKLISLFLIAYYSSCKGCETHTILIVFGSNITLFRYWRPFEFQPIEGFIYYLFNKTIFVYLKIVVFHKLYATYVICTTIFSLLLWPEKNSLKSLIISLSNKWKFGKIDKK